MIEWRCHTCGEFYVLGWWHKLWKKHEPDGTYP